MLYFSYGNTLALITGLWLLFRIGACVRDGRFCLRKEAQLLLVYFCFAVVVRFAFFPFGRVEGEIGPLVFDRAQMLPPRVNFVPFVHLFDYPTVGEALLNLIGNTAMFLPLGIVWPWAFKKLDTHNKVILSGVGFSLTIEVLQLPFYDRVTDIDDLILNSAGFVLGYGIYVATKALRLKKLGG